MTYLTAILAGASLIVLTWTITFSVRTGQLRRSNRRLRESLEGIWVEHIPASLGHSITIGRIYFDKKKAAFQFDGMNYYDNFLPYCYFQTVASVFDVASLKLFYTFSAHLTGDLDKTYHGFGWVTLGRSDGEFNVEDGYYISASVDGVPMSHTMYRAPVLQSKRSWKKVYSVDEMRTIVQNAGLSDHFKPEVSEISEERQG